MARSNFFFFFFFFFFKKSDFVGLFVEGEMAGSSSWISVSGRSRRNALAPAAMKEGSFRPQATRVGGLWCAQPGLPRRVRGDVGAVIVEQIGLDLALARSGQTRVLVGPGVRVVAFRMRRAEG